jgi:hypothetical protein
LVADNDVGRNAIKGLAEIKGRIHGKSQGAEPKGPRGRGHTL